LPKIRRALGLFAYFVGIWAEAGPAGGRTRPGGAFFRDLAAKTRCFPEFVQYYQ